MREQTARVGQGLLGEVALSGATALIPYAPLDSRVMRFDTDLLQVHSMLVVPMRFHNEVLGVLAVVNRVDGLPFSESDANLLQALADQASVSVHYAKFSAALDEKRRLDYDLNLARRIQTALLPSVLPDIRGVEVAAFSVPAQQVGGDYYDFVVIDEDHTGIAIADVSGKSVAGAIVMSVCRSVLRIEARGCLSPGTVLRRVNRILSPDLSEDMFISLLYGVLDTRTRELVLARAGHVCPIVSRGRGEEPQVIDSRGVAIGLGDPDTFDAVLQEVKVPLAQGDVVVAYTDGVTEAMDRAQNEWGVHNLLRTLQVTVMEGGGAANVARNVQQKLLQFVGESAPSDDMTLVVLRMK